MSSSPFSPWHNILASSGFGKEAMRPNLEMAITDVCLIGAAFLKCSLKGARWCI